MNDFDPNEPHQRNLRTGRYSTPFGIYHVTKCLILGAPHLSEVQRDDVVAALLHFRERQIILLHSFVIMPDHWHALISLSDTKPLNLTIRDLIRRASFPSRERGAAIEWQKSFHDHKAREGESIVEIRRYIEGNPVRKGLVAQPELWRWSSAHRDHREKLDRHLLGFERWDRKD